MKFSSLVGAVCLFFFTTCVDRIVFDVPSSVFPVVVDGWISDQPGPYEIRLTKAFDIESKSSIKTPIAANRVIISDNLGNQEVLDAASQGIYRTRPDGIRGVAGRAYRLRVELLDGRIYESTPDTLRAAGQVDEVSYQFTSKASGDKRVYGFDVFFDAQSGSSKNFYFLWRFIATYQVDTNPELYTQPCGESRCPTPLPCSGHVVEGGSVVRVGPCSCCTCWVSDYSDTPIISDDQFIQGGRFINVPAGRVPLDSRIFSNKVYAAVEQRSLSRPAFSFWKAIKEQKEAVNSLFQPIAGRVPTNFKQVAGAEGPIQGYFYAAGISVRGQFITREDIPDPTLVPPPPSDFFDACTRFPNSTTTKPAFWD